jgi:hypothetical protein
VRRGRIIAIVVAVGLAGCRRSGAPAPSASAAPSPAARLELALPDALAGFAAGPDTLGPGYVRRTYARGRTLIDVTLAQAPMPPGGFDGWLTMSRAFPQAVLDAPAAEVNGFYQCTETPAPSCDLLIQMRSGVHVEIRGGGTSSREDVDAIARGLPLRALGASVPAEPAPAGAPP